MVDQVLMSDDAKLGSGMGRVDVDVDVVDRMCFWERLLISRRP